jgi:YfiH family protein
VIDDQPAPIVHPGLAARGVEHGFGVRGWRGPEGLVRPRQVHGVAVAWAGADRAVEPETADAVLAEAGGPPVAVVTADCVPILVGAEGGRRVAAIHAGWRGLAAGVIGAAFAEWRRRFGDEERLYAAIGPHAGACCYEVDAPVRAAFDAFGAATLARAFASSRPGHWMLELAVLARAALVEAGLDEGDLGVVEDACTICHPGRFESYRREGAAAGRLVHAVTPRPAPDGPANDPA